MDTNSSVTHILHLLSSALSLCMRSVDCEDPIPRPFAIGTKFDAFTLYEVCSVINTILYF